MQQQEAAQQKKEEELRQQLIALQEAIGKDAFANMKGMIDKKVDGKDDLSVLEKIDRKILIVKTVIIHSRQIKKDYMDLLMVMLSLNSDLPKSIETFTNIVDNAKTAATTTPVSKDSVGVASVGRRSGSLASLVARISSSLTVRRKNFTPGAGAGAEAEPSTGLGVEPLFGPPSDKVDEAGLTGPLFGEPPVSASLEAAPAPAPAPAPAAPAPALVVPAQTPAQVSVVAKPPAPAPAPAQDPAAPPVSAAAAKPPAPAPASPAPAPAPALAAAAKPPAPAPASPAPAPAPALAAPAKHPAPASAEEPAATPARVVLAKPPAPAQFPKGSWGEYQEFIADRDSTSGGSPALASVSYRSVAEQPTAPASSLAAQSSAPAPAPAALAPAPAAALSSVGAHPPATTSAAPAQPTATAPAIPSWVSVENAASAWSRPRRDESGPTQPDQTPVGPQDQTAADSRRPSVADRVEMFGGRK